MVFHYTTAFINWLPSTKNKFRDWLLQVNKIVFNKINIELQDLPDELYRDIFDNGYSATYMSGIIIDHYHELL